MPAIAYVSGASADTDVWSEWASDVSTGTTSAVWEAWVDTADCTTAGSTTTATVATTVWVRWNTATAATNCTASVPARLVRSRSEGLSVLTAEEQRRLDEERLRREEECRRKAEEEKARREAAAKRAARLLRRHLTRRQQREYARDQAFHVHARSGRRYRIACRRSGNVTELNAEGKEVMRFCVHPAEDVPDQDTMLAQKLWLEADEEAFRRAANRTPLV